MLLRKKFDFAMAIMFVTVHHLSHVLDIPLSQLPRPSVKGDGLAIAIPEEEYIAGIDECKHNLHGRIVWPKGSFPLTVLALKQKLGPLWKDLSRWGISSTCKGLCEFTFSNLEDVRRVRSVVSWNLNSGFLKLFAWLRDFNPAIQQRSTSHVWVKRPLSRILEAKDHFCNGDMQW